jgi:thioesterase domain-containing protein
VNSLVEAIRKTQPHLIVPCDDRAVQHLHELHARESSLPSSEVCRLIEESLGAPASYPVVSTRYQLLKIALQEGLPVPDTDLVVAGQSFSSWSAKHKLPWVLKASGTWGGHGTKIVHDEKNAEEFVRQASKPLTAARAVKRLVVDRDPFWILPWRLSSTAEVIVQSYVEGYPANCAVVCRNGKVLAGIAVEVVCAQGETGSATIVRVVDDSGMMRAAERLVARLGLSGFFGFDFVIEARTGTPYLIEMNPRVTPLCHWQHGPKPGLVDVLSAQLTGRPAVGLASPALNDLIAYFPQAWHWDKHNKLLRASFHDIPWEEPGLVRELLRLPWPDRGILARLSNHVRRLSFEDRRARGGIFTEAVRGLDVLPKPESSIGSMVFNPADPEKRPAVVPIRQSGSKPPLFLIHGVDGHINCFYGLTRYLKPDQPVYGILSQALLGESVVLTRIEQLAAYYLEQIQILAPSGPYHLIGFSYGGFVAFEMARQLHAQGQSIGVVGMVDVLPMQAGMRRGPPLTASERNEDRQGNMTPTLAHHANRLFQAGGLSYAREKIARRAMRGIYAVLDWAGFRIPASLQRAYDLSWFAAVRYTPRLFPGRLTLFQTAAWREAACSDGGRWEGLAGQVEVLEVAGDHESAFEEPQVQSLAIQLTKAIEST